MRELTIRRNKSFVGCTGKDQVYIRDEQAPELTIEGVPCRKLGELKNGEQRTFLIGEQEQQIFVIVDSLSKEYCNASVMVPEGLEDVFLSGKHKFVLGSNPFCFDGVLTPGQKKRAPIGIIVCLLAGIVGMAAGMLVTGSFLKQEKTESKIWKKDEFSITMNKGFTEKKAEGYFVYYESQNALVVVLREEQMFFVGSEMTLEEYGQQVLETNDRGDETMNQGDGFVWIEYTEDVRGQEIYYLVACYKSEGAFWVVNFAAPGKYKEEYKNTFMQWAESVEFEKAG